jgi:glycosyltransferase involved in cell wall biosynthesis
LWQVLNHAYARLGFDVLDDDAFAQLVLARVIEPLAVRRHGEAARSLVGTWAERINMGRVAAKAAGRLVADAVHLHDPWLAWGWLRSRAWHRSTAGWGVSQHATREEGLPSTPAILARLVRLEGRVLQQADWVVCPTDAARAQLARDLALPEPPPHWHHVSHARPRHAGAVRALRARGEPPHVVAIGRLDPVKRMEAVVQACARLGRPVRLTVLGGGDAARLRALVPPGTALAVDVHVTDDVAACLATADVYVSASRNESFGLANLEALAQGVPAVCTAVGGVPEVTGGAAWLVPAGDVGLAERLAEAVRMLLDDDALAQTLGARGAERARSWPDTDVVAESLERLYRPPGGAT